MLGGKSAVKQKYFKGGMDFTIDFSEDDINVGLAEQSSSDLFLHKYRSEDMLGLMEEVGILAGLRGKGHTDVQVSFDSSDPFVHKMVWHSGGMDEPLCECFLRITATIGAFHAVSAEGAAREGAALVRDWAAAAERDHRLQLLVVEWLLLQDPLAPLSGKVLLPGQHLPGLGVGALVGDLLVLLARENGCDAMINRPLFFHNAVMYAPTGTLFLNPEVEGKFRAVVRDLQPEIARTSLAEVSQAIRCGGLVWQRTGAVLVWAPDEQARAISDRMKAFLSSAAYQELISRHYAETEEIHQHSLQQIFHDSHRHPAIGSASHDDSSGSDEPLAGGDELPRAPGVEGSASSAEGSRLGSASCRAEDEVNFVIDWNVDLADLPAVEERLKAGLPFRAAPTQLREEGHS